MTKLKVYEIIINKEVEDMIKVKDIIKKINGMQNIAGQHFYAINGEELKGWLNEI